MGTTDIGAVLRSTKQLICIPPVFEVVFFTTEPHTN